MRIDYARNKKYFTQAGLKRPIIAVVVGILLFLAGISANSGVTALLGFLIAAAGGARIYFLLNGPKDQDIDRDAIETVADLQERALSKLGLDPDQVRLIEPVIANGYLFASIGDDVLIKLGKDKKFRASNYEGVVIFFSEHQLHSYKFQFSLVNPDEFRESTDEYFYRDVVSVATSSESYKVRLISGESRQVTWEEFKLTTSGATSIRSSIRDQSSVAKSIAGARNLIRDRKMAS
jgi:hypothetical protein